MRKEQKVKEKERSWSDISYSLYISLFSVMARRHKADVISAEVTRCNKTWGVRASHVHEPQTATAMADAFVMPAQLVRLRERRRASSCFAIFLYSICIQTFANWPYSLL